MARDLKARFILELQDRLSSGLGAIQARLGSLRAVAQRLAGVGLIGAALTFAGPIRAAAAYDDVLRQSVITQGLLGDAAEREVTRVGQLYEQLARRTGQSSLSIASGAADLVAANLPREVIEQMMPMIARAATATGTSIEDLSKLAISLNQNLRVGPEQMTQAFAAMTQAGMDGRFELREMAAEFPRLTAMAEGLGLTGLRAVNSLGAMLQIARRGAASSSEAANNLGNFLGKITAPEIVRNFQKAGTDLPALLRSAAERGYNPIEVVIQRVREISGGDMFKVGELFGDQQVLNFLRPMLAGVGEYQRVLAGAAAANAELLDQGFATRWASLHISVARLTEGLTQLSRRVGAALAPQMKMLADTLDGLMSWMKGFEAANPGVISSVVGWGAAAFMAAAALGSVALVLPTIITGATLLLAPLRLLMIPLRLVMMALVGIGAPAALAASLVALAAGALVLAAIHIWRNWERFRGFFSDLWAGIRGIFGGFVAWVAAWFTGSQADRVAAVMQMWDGLKTFFGALWGIVRTLFVDFVAWLDEWTGGAVTEAVNSIIGLWNQIVTGVQQVWDDVGREFDNFITAIGAWIDGAVVPWIERFKAPWEALKGFFSGLFGEIGRIFNAIWAPIEAAITRLRGLLPEGEAGPRADAEAPTRGPGRRSFNPGAIMAGQNARLNGEIIVRAAPGTEVVRAAVDAPEVRVTAPDRGAMLAAP